ncbi:hypothetical protein [Sphingomonas sp. 28-63-12]|uniref:hypothetical protein n=1 Tax=Sphingomonas sp. 28-63-12 TaxID=1970434 RepID=UPI000BDD5F53|nr:MAG: hypothetical protein B7Y47_16620 [Sphingomonas sp. 28-63-12]
MSKFWKSKTILAKMETTYGTDPTPTGAANAILASDVTWSPMEGSDVARNVERGYFAADPTVAAELRCVLTFTVELVGSGTAGTAPAWGPLLRMSGVNYSTVLASRWSGNTLYYKYLKHFGVIQAGNNAIGTATSRQLILDVKDY